jgi:hypothetical protein
VPVSYYYAGGQKVDLHKDDDYVGVDQSLAPAGLIADLASAFAGAPQMSGGVVLAPRSSIGAAAMASLQAAGATRPVFRRGAALMVALPEVRVEMDDPLQRHAVDELLADPAHGMLIKEEGAGRLVLTPASGSAADALRMANKIYEEAHPASSSVRFLQFTPRPDGR